MILFTTWFLSACAATVPAPTILSVPDPSPAIRIPGAVAELAVTRIAHASVLLDFAGKVVLTDPWFTEAGQYHHGEPLALDVARLPRLAAVVVSHGHYDHFDIDAFAAYPDKAVPMVLAPGLAEAAQAAGFTDVRELDTWDQTEVDGLRFTAAPGAHGVLERTFVIEGAGSTVFFGGDSQRIDELDEVAVRFPSIDLALLSVNGLRIVPMFGHQVVMSAEQAGELCGVFRPKVAVPMHFRFRGGWFTETFILAYDGTPERFVAAAAEMAPDTVTRILEPGQRLALVP